jgi:hypothetical protein
MVPCAEAVGAQTNVQASRVTTSAMTPRRLVVEPEVLRIRIDEPPFSDDRATVIDMGALPEQQPH